MDPVTYTIPVALLEAYRGRRVILRCRELREPIERLSKEDLDNIACIQLPITGGSIEDLIHWGESIPLDLLMVNPPTDFPLLYQYSGLLAGHPVRVSLPVVPGFGKAVRLAVALGFAVKLEVTQPDQALIEEMAEVLDFYLHQSMVSQSVDFFHGLLFAFYHNVPATLWSIQEEDPALFRYLNEQGEETLPRGFMEAGADSGDFVESFRQALLAGKADCSDCEFFAHCGGYFKWPRQEYRCEGIRSLLGTIQSAAHELRKDLAGQPGPAGERQP